MTRKGRIVANLVRDLPAATQRAVKAAVIGAVAAAGMIALSL
jgi:hypothetical protein